LDPGLHTATTVPTPARILITRLSHLGDVVHALPVFHALREANPAAEIGWAIQPEFAPLVRGLEGLERIFLFERKGGAGAWLRLRRELMAWRADWAVDAQGNLKSAVATRLSSAPRRTGLAVSDWTEGLGARFMTEHAPPSAGAHAMDRMRTLARFVAGTDELRRDLALEPDERLIGETLFSEHFPAQGGGWILQLGKMTDVRTWPAEHFADLARRLAAKGEAVLVLSGPEEAPMGVLLAAALADVPDVAHWIGQRGLRDLAAFYTAAARRGVRLVGCDSGPSHIAAACDLPVALLAGPQDPGRTGPWPAGAGGPGHRALLSEAPPDCMPCLARTCAHPGGAVCLSSLEPSAVLQQLFEMQAQ